MKMFNNFLKEINQLFVKRAGGGMLICLDISTGEAAKNFFFMAVLLRPYPPP